MSSVKKAAALIICLALLLTGCGGTGRFGFAGNGTSADDLMEAVDICVSQGERFTGLLMDETAAYFYGFAGATASSMRLAVEKILWLKGEGDDFASFAADSRYTDWDTIAEICYASPYPYYFEGLIYDVQGEAEKADELYGYASVMTNFPEEGLDFYWLRDLSVSDLYKLRDELRKIEDGIYGKYTPMITGYERSVFCGISQYLYYDACELFVNESYEAALIPARYALRMDPKMENYWILAVTAAIGADRPHLATVWIEEGMKYFPESEKLGALLKSLQAIDSGAVKEE